MEEAHQIVVIVIGMAITLVFGLVIILLQRRQIVKLEYLVFYDSPTGVYNKHYMEERLKELGFARESSLPISLIYIDVDKLKSVNDKLGHVAGDLYLRQVAKTIRATVRKSDTVGRLGGDEFVVIMPKTDCEASQEVAVLVQENCLAEISFGKSGRGSISFGVAVRETESQKIEEIRKKAEEKMYEQKKAKRYRR